MLVADTSALVSLAAAETLQLVLGEFEVHTTQTVVEELQETADYDDVHAAAAQRTLEQRDELAIHEVDAEESPSARIDDGEMSCVALLDELDGQFLITDDYRALPELRAVTESRIAISPIVLKALVERGVLTIADAEDQLETMAEHRDWLEAPIYREARRLFQDE